MPVEWKGYSKDRTFSLPALYLDFAMVILHDSLDQLESQTGPGSGTAFVTSVIALEDMRQLLFRYSNSGIAYCNEYSIVSFISLHAKSNAPAARCILESIVEQVGEHLG